jgi:hypothetical protein
MRKLLLLALLAILLAPTLRAQSFDLEQGREQVMDLTGQWHFHTGDDPAWAQPGFDDSGWKLLRSDEPWSEQGYKGYGGMAWYRFQVFLPAKHPPLALYIPELLTSYQVYANGRTIGQFGGMPPHAKADFPLPQLIAIPNAVLTPSQPLTIAIRIWHWPFWATSMGGGPQEGDVIQIGTASALDAPRELRSLEKFHDAAAQGLLALIEVLAGLAGITLFLLGPSEREYLWFGAFELLTAASNVIEVWQLFRPVGTMGNFALQGCATLLAQLCLLAFLFILLRQRRGWLYWIAIGSLPFASLAWLLGNLQWISFSSWYVAIAVAFLPFFACVLILLVSGARRGNTDARLLLLPFGLDCAAIYVGAALSTLYWSGATLPAWLSAANTRFNTLATRPFPFSASNAADFLFQLGLLAVLLLRFARARRDEQRLANEMEAARAVQQVLVPEEIPAIAGLAIACVYRPAGEVGGDFFQVIGLPGGGVLAAIGDVSGKGMPAAMTVSLLVGALRTLAHYTQRPAEILAAMNQRMMGRSGGGFTTCLVLRMDAGGALTLANAGHLSPYRNGEEIHLDSALPLGIAPGTTYSESTLRLQPGDTLTFLSDGVVEARNASGELFGFDRTRQISTQSAEQIADKAQSFGQQDDITVLTLTFAPAEVLRA